MRALGFGRHLFSICVAALLAGCGASQPPIAVPGVMPQTLAPAAHAAHARSWMATDAKSKDLLYVTNGQVDVYSYPQGEMEGQLTGFADAYGACTDKKGDVYITDYTDDNIVEYAHGGTQPIRTLSVPGNASFSCAVDPSTGDLAVTNEGNTSGGGANFAIYAKAKGTPKTYTYDAIAGYVYCTYDDAGNLFVDGFPARGCGYNFELAELPHRGKSLKPVLLRGGLAWAAALQWNRPYLVTGQPVRPNIWRYVTTDGFGVSFGSTPLSGAYEALQFIIAGNKAIVVNLYYYDVYIVRWDVLVYNYPAGGYETQEIVDSDSPLDSVALSRHR